jgi:hypothetical protein
MILLGYKYKKPDSLNLNFKAKYKKWLPVKKRLFDQSTKFVPID